MKGLFYVLGKIWNFFFLNGAFLSKLAPGMFIISAFFFNLIDEGFAFALREIAMSVFSAEKIIQRNVTLAISNSPEYGFIQFFEIIISFMIIYNLIKLFTKALQKGPGGQSEWGCMVFAVMIVFLIEYVAVLLIAVSDYFITGTIEPEFLKFIPVWDGIILHRCNRNW